MRRPILARERFCQCACVRQKNGRSLSGELLKVANQVSLVIIAAIGGYSRPTGISLFECTEDLLEAQNATE